MGRFEALLPKILRLLAQKKEIHYTELAVECDIASSTASQYATLLARKYPDNITYERSYLKLKMPFKSEEIPRDVLEGLVDEMDERERKLKENHIPHLERALLNSDLKKMKEEIKRLKELFEGEG